MNHWKAVSFCEIFWDLFVISAILTRNRLEFQLDYSTVGKAKDSFRSSWIITIISLILKCRYFYKNIILSNRKNIFWRFFLWSILASGNVSKQTHSYSCLNWLSLFKSKFEIFSKILYSKFQEKKMSDVRIIAAPKTCDVCGDALYDSSNYYCLLAIKKLFKFT